MSINSHEDIKSVRSYRNNWQSINMLDEERNFAIQAFKKDVGMMSRLEPIDQLNFDLNCLNQPSNNPINNLTFRHNEKMSLDYPINGQGLEMQQSQLSHQPQITANWKISTEKVKSLFERKEQNKQNQPNSEQKDKRKNIDIFGSAQRSTFQHNVFRSVKKWGLKLMQRIAKRRFSNVRPEHLKLIDDWANSSNRRECNSSQRKCIYFTPMIEEYLRILFQIVRVEKTLTPWDWRRILMDVMIFIYFCVFMYLLSLRIVFQAQLQIPIVFALCGIVIHMGEMFTSMVTGEFIGGQLTLLPQQCIISYIRKKLPFDIVSLVVLSSLLLDMQWTHNYWVFALLYITKLFTLLCSIARIKRRMSISYSLKYIHRVTSIALQFFFLTHFLAVAHLLLLPHFPHFPTPSLHSYFVINPLFIYS